MLISCIIFSILFINYSLKCINEEHEAYNATMKTLRDLVYILNQKFPGSTLVVKEDKNNIEVTGNLIFKI